MSLENYIYQPLILVRIHSYEYSYEHNPFLVPEKFKIVIEKIIEAFSYTNEEVVFEIGDVFRLNSYGEISMFKSLFNINCVIEKEENIPGNFDAMNLLK